MLAKSVRTQTLVGLSRRRWLQNAAYRSPLPAFNFARGVCMLLGKQPMEIVDEASST